MIKHIMPLSLVSLLATCQPSYAIAPHYQPLNNHSFNYVDVVAVNGNNDRQELSQSISVTPQRYCGFFAPLVCLASQASLTDCASAAASHPRLQSVYDGTTRPNKPLANKSGGTNTPRVNPVTLISQVSVIQNSKVLGVVNHG
jgi:hypothetical protein